MSWTTTEDGCLFCDRHGQKFDPDKLETCERCSTDPGPAVQAVDEAATPPPEGCLSALEHERRFTALADELEKLARELAGTKPEPTGKPGRPRKTNLNAAVKLLAEATKARRAASALARQREDAVEVTRLEKLDAGLRGSH